MTLDASVSMGWVGTVIAAARQQGIDADTLLHAAGLDAAELDRERWPIDHITRLWRAAEHCSGDRAFGLTAGAGVSPANIDVVGFVMQSAASLRDAIGMVQKYQRLISDGGRFQLLTGERASWLVYHPHQGELAFSPHQIEAVLAAVVSLAKWITGTPLTPQRVQFSQSRLAEVNAYQQVFACPVDFDQAFSGLLIDNRVLDSALPQADHRLAQVHQQVSTERLAELHLDAVSVPAMRQWLRARIGPRVPRRAEAARTLGLSERTLARRLHTQGHSFDRLLDEVRREMALNAVADHSSTLAEIAQALGFAESSTFYRAFQRWTGMPPGRWRRQHTTG